ncbi:hypothetical protein [Streptomyces misionensis]|uniref:hypothetical protein n=1 Tax=Streptomyces misionensis TaxID=67331 RepID=UPI003675B405
MSAPGFVPLESLPPAHRKIVAALLAHGWDRADAEEMLLDYASELTQVIREERKAMEAEAIPEHAHLLDGMAYAADTIDPHASAAPVRPDEEPTT